MLLFASISLLFLNELNKLFHMFTLIMVEIVKRFMDIVFFYTDLIGLLGSNCSRVCRTFRNTPDSGVS